MKIKEQFRGTGLVFRFTFLQLLKSRTTIVTMLLALLFAMGAVPVTSLIRGGTAQSAGIGTVYLDNRTDLDLSGMEACLREQAGGEQIRVLSGALPEDDGTGLGLTFEEDGEQIALTVSWNSAEASVTSSVFPLGSAAYDFADRARLAQLGLGETEIGLLSDMRTSWVSTPGEFEEGVEAVPDIFGDGPSFDDSNYYLQIGYSVILMMFCIYSVGYVVRTVIEEKQSKLVDLLMVSVKPAALLLGKVLAALLFVMIYMFLLFGGMMLSLAVTDRFLDISAAPGALQVLSGMKPDALSLVVVVVTGVLGCLAFGLLGGLCGAGCSNMQESGGAMTTCTMLIMIGYMFSLFIPMTGGMALKVCCVIPVLSMFTAPLQFMAGHIGFGTVALSWVLQIACCLFLVWLSARVYSSLIMYNGKRLSFGKILALAGRKEERS